MIIENCNSSFYITNGNIKLTAYFIIKILAFLFKPIYFFLKMNIFRDGGGWGWGYFDLDVDVFSMVSYTWAPSNDVIFGQGLIKKIRHLFFLFVYNPLFCKGVTR